MKVPKLKTLPAHQVPFGQCFLARLGDLPVVGMAVDASEASNRGWIVLSPPLPETGSAHILSNETISGPVFLIDAQVGVPNDPSAIISGSLGTSLVSGSLVLRADGRPHVWVRYDQRKSIFVDCETGEPKPGIPQAENLCFSRWQIVAKDANDQWQTVCEINAV